jgi:hypothetical protein
VSSLRQIEANRRNALKSTGPKTAAGKRRSRRNSVRHGLTAEVVVEVLEDARDYKAFERAVTVEFDAQTAVERELVLRLASLLWRLRRSTAIESGLLQIQNGIIQEAEQERSMRSRLQEPHGSPSVRLVNAMPGTKPDLGRDDHRGGSAGGPTNKDRPIDGSSRNGSTNAEIARCFQRLANVDNGAFERLTRYETALWRQAERILFILKLVRRQSRRDMWRLKSESFSPFLGDVSDSRL